MRPHMLTVLVLALATVMTVIVVGVAQTVVADNEERLLDQRSNELVLIVRSLGENLQTSVAAATVAADAAGGDPGAFGSFVERSEEDRARTWVLLRRSAFGMDEVMHTGEAPLLDTNRTDAVNHELVDAADGGLAIIALAGDSAPLEALGVAAGRPGVASDYLAYEEIPLLQAAAGSAGGGEGTQTARGFEDVGIELYLGRHVDPDRRVLSLAMDDVEGPTARRPFTFGGQHLLLVVGATKPLTGNLTADLPLIVLLVAGIVGLLITVVVELTLRRRDRALALVRALETANGELDRALVDQRQTTEANEALEEEMRRMQRLDAIGQLAGGIAHDFNNLLAAILSYAELAESDLAGHQSQSDISEIRRAAERGAALTRQLLAFSRREPGSPDHVDVNSVIGNVVRLMARTIPADVSLRTDLAEGLPAVLTDAGELEQVLVNLVVNARDAVSPGGGIDIETSAEILEPSDLDTYPGMMPGPVVRLIVHDDGIGMSSDVQAHAFEPFFTTKERGRGTGLGLATVYGIVQRWGGHIALLSAPGTGTTFVIHLPAALEGAATPSEGRTAALRGAGETILLAEDERPVRRGARRHLEGAGYAVLEADNGAHALELAGAHPIDLLLTDLVMPGRMTGRDLAAALTADRPTLPVIYMTGYSGDAGDGGPTLSPLLRKPFTAQALLLAVRTALDATAAPVAGPA